MIKTIIVLFNFVFKCSFVNETRAIAIVRAGMQANQLVRASDRAGNITNFTENGASKSFFCQYSTEKCSLIFASIIKKVYQENIPFVKTIDIYVFIKGILN